MLHKIYRRAAAAALCLFCLVSLTGCGKWIGAAKDIATGKEVDVRALLGMSTDDAEEDAAFVVAQKGGKDVPYPDGFDIDARMSTGMNGNTLCVAFNRIGISGRSTGYFSPKGSSITVTAAAKTESPGMFNYKAALWRKVEGGTEYVPGCTIQFTCDGDLYKAELKGLDPDERYKLLISYDSAIYYISGGMSVDGVKNGEELDENGDEDEAATA